MNCCGVPQAARLQILSPIQTAGRMALPSFFLWGLGLCGHLASGACSRDSRTVRGQEMSACLTHLSGVARELLPLQVAPIQILSPIQTAGRMALPSFFYGVRQENFPTEGIPLAQIRKKMRRGESLLPVPHSYQGSPENCLHRRWRQRIAPTAGGARELIPPQVVLSTKSLDGCIIMLSAAGDSRLLIPNKGVSRHEVFHLPCCI